MMEGGELDDKNERKFKSKEKMNLSITNNLEEQSFCLADAV